MHPSKRAAAGIAAAMFVALFVGFAPSAGAQTGYEMFGYGELVATEGPGMAACPPACDQNPTTVYTFQTLPITGIGVLLGEAVAGNYNCPSNVTVVGNTSNFDLNWDFTCTKTDGLGPDVITGSFTNHETPGAPVFSGVFRVGDDEVQSVCSGGFAPTQMDGTNIRSAFFAGECTAAGA